MSISMNPAAQAFFERISAALRQKTDMSGIADWIINNTTDPRNPAKPWSFLDHEFQIEILNDSANRVVVRKCSQVGVSEIIVRLQLAMLAIYTNSTAIYTLPTTSFARQFTKSRIDPVIRESPLLRPMVPTNNDSSELKQIGGSFLYIRGSFGQGAAISIPADILINDEVDFSNPKALTTFASRLGHAKNGGFRREFSTPTVEGYGISKTFDISSKARYHIKHDKCGEWVAPNWFDHIHIPGFDKDIIEFERHDLRDPRYDIEGAWLACPSCNNRIKWDNICDPTKRMWIHESPDVEIRGYQVMPFDVPAVNPLSKTLGHLDDYERKADWVNFKLGLPFQDAESSFLLDRILANEVLRAITASANAADGCVLGLDVGKTSWAVILRPEGKKLQVIYRERIKQEKAGHAIERTQELMGFFGVRKAVIDAGPDFTTALSLIENNPDDRVYGCYYVRSVGNKMTNYVVDDAEGIIKADRTLCFDSLAKKANSGLIQYPKDDEQELMRKHLLAMKRVTHMNNQGEYVNYWTSVDEDHYAHALNYAHLAFQLLGHNAHKGAVPALPMAGRTKVKSHKHEEGATQLPVLTELNRGQYGR